MKNKEVAEPMFWWATILLPVVTAAAIVYARAQVAVIAKQARATLLLELVNKWNSQDMESAKLIFRGIDRASRNKVFPENSNMNDNEGLRKLEDHFSQVMKNMSYDEEKANDYHTLCRLMTFFETLGLFVNKGYVSLEDVDGLFRGPILQTGLLFTKHIHEKQQERGIYAGLYENALSLIAKIKQRLRATT
jgi:hypothetical protein